MRFRSLLLSCSAAMLAAWPAQAQPLPAASASAAAPSPPPAGSSSASAPSPPPAAPPPAAAPAPPPPVPADPILAPIAPGLPRAHALEAADLPPPIPRQHDDHPTGDISWRWPQFRPYQFALTGGQLAAAFGSLAIPGQARFGGVNPLDDAVRDALRADSFHGNQTARDASDIGLAVLVNQRLVDTLFVTWWYHDKGSTAWQLGLIDVQTLTFTAAVNGLVAGIAGRERPYGRDDGYCNDDPLWRDAADCSSNKRYRSFFSGHASTSFTLAGLTCMHHAHLPLYGGGFADALPCIGTMAAAGTVATMRVVADQHYFTDVLVGAAFGTAAGLGIPYLFHYRFDAPASGAADPSQGTTISVLPTPGGISLGGQF